MIGSSRASQAEVREAVNAAFDNPELEQAGRDLLQVADLVAREKPLRQALSDAGRSSADRTAILTGLIQGKVNDLAVSIAGLIAGLRWSTESDLVDAFERAGVQCLFGAAEKADQLDRVENELFRFGRIAAADADLQMALSSPALPAATKSTIVADLLNDKAAPATVEVLSYITAHLRGRRLDQAVDGMADLAAERRGKLVAVVHVARPLTDEQAARLTAALERVYNQSVTMNIEIDPDLVGGITVQIGDDVIDGSIANRLDTARRRISG